MIKASRRKWLFNIGTFFSALGIAFLLIEEFNTYNTVAFILLVVGIALFIASNLYREK